MKAVRLFGKQQANQANNASDASGADEQTIYPGARCGMLVGEPWVEKQTGEIKRLMCGAPATEQWNTTETSADEVSVTVAILLCAEHVAVWRAAVTLDGSTVREVYPAGTLARVSRGSRASRVAHRREHLN